MPTWVDGEATMYVMYEDTSEGTPISPAFANPYALARWLADSEASSFGGCTSSYEDWLSMILGSGYSVGMVMDDEGIKSDVGIGEPRPDTDTVAVRIRDILLETGIYDIFQEEAFSLVYGDFEGLVKDLVAAAKEK